MTESSDFINILKLCCKAGQKLSALLRLSPYLDTNKSKTIYNIMAKSHFNYCPLVWMFCPRRSNNLITKVQERALCITYNDQLTDFKSLLSNHNEITTHQRNFKVLMTEIYKIINYIVLQQCHLYLKYANTFTTRDTFKSSLMKAGEQ